MIKYSHNFERDFRWYLKVRHLFNFDGAKDYFTKTGESAVQYDKNGVSGKVAFYLWDSQGKIVKTKHPNLLYTILKTKGSVNLHIKMYAEDLANLTLIGLEVRAFAIKIKAPSWFRESITRQRYKLVPYQTNTSNPK